MTARIATLAVLVVTACAVAAPPATAQDAPQTFVVNTTANTGSGSLRAAITAANANNNGSAPDRINFALALNSQITIDAALPPITQRVSLNGCSNDPGSIGRCVGVKPTTGGSLATLLDVDANGVTVDGIAWSGASGAAVRVRPARNAFVARRNQFGRPVANAGTNERNGIGLLIEGDGATVGGTDPTSTNLFVNNTTALKILGGDDTVIQGNLFGVDFTFSQRDPNDENIEVVGNGPVVGVPQPDRTLIGGIPTAAQAATPECDGPCNVIAGANGRVSGRFVDDGDGIDLDGEVSANELPAGDTTIQGNHIGVNRFGSSGAPEDGITWSGNRHRGIQASDDPQPPHPLRTVTVGGDSPAAANVIARNREGGVSIGAGAVVRNNRFGMNSGGTTALPNRGTDLGITGGSPIVRDNRFGGTPESRFPSLSLSSVVEGDVRGNTWGIFDQHRGAAISLSNAHSVTVGGIDPGDANVIVRAGEPSVGALDIHGGDGHTILGNLFGRTPAGDEPGNAYAAITIEDAPDVTIGGLSEAAENVIAGSRAVEDTSLSAFVGGFGIELHDPSLTSDPETDDVTILRNRGLGNEKDFIDLNGDGPGNPANGPNDGVQAPVIDGATGTTASATVTGTAQPGAVVLLFEPGSGGITRYVSTANTPASGRWNAAVGAQAAGDHSLVATQTVGDSTSELTPASFTYSVSSPPSGDPGGGGGPGAGGGSGGGGPGGGGSSPGGPSGPNDGDPDQPIVFGRAALNGKTATFTLKKVLRVGITCPRATTNRCGGTLTVDLPGKKPVRLGKLNIRLQPGQKTTVGWKIKRSLVGKLRKRGAKVTATITPPVGSTAQPIKATLKIKLEQRKKKR